MTRSDMTTMAKARRVFIAALLLGLALPAAFGCRSAPVTWEEAQGNAADGQDTANVSPEEVAAQASTAFACVDSAKSALARDAGRGRTLFEACVRRPDFVDIGLYNEAPFSAELARLDPERLLLGSLLARRGGNVRGDLEFLASEGFGDVTSVADALYTGVKKDTLLIVRARVIGPTEESGVWILEELALKSPRSSGRIWVANPRLPAPTTILAGNRLLMERKRGGEKLRPGDERVFVLRASYVTPFRNDDEGYVHDHLRCREVGAFAVNKVGY